jgi:hypothetical protein
MQFFISWTEELAAAVYVDLAGLFTSVIILLEIAVGELRFHCCRGYHLTTNFGLLNAVLIALP